VPDYLRTRTASFYVMVWLDGWTSVRDYSHRGLFLSSASRLIDRLLDPFSRGGGSTEMRCRDGDHYMLTIIQDFVRLESSTTRISNIVTSLDSSVPPSATAIPRQAKRLPSQWIQWRHVFPILRPKISKVHTSAHSRSLRKLGQI
jgi:hypothetical protein